MFKDPTLLPFFIHEELFLLPEDRKTSIGRQPVAERAATPPEPASREPVKQTSAPLEKPLQPKEEPKKAAPAATTAAAPKAAPALNPNLIFGKNQKKLLILVEDHQNPVMERADGLLLKDILKALGYTFDDVAIVNICHCREEAEWEAVKQIPFDTLFSFGITHPQLPFTKALAPYELERSGERKFLLADKLSVLRTNRSKKIALWNLLKEVFV